MKFTNLKRGIAGVCAATLLTGMCAVPAFAKDASGTTNVTIGGNGATGNSAVILDAADLQVSATVPTNLPIVIVGDTITFPTKAQIAATGKAGVKVSNVAASMAGGVTGLTLKDSEASLGDNEAYIAVNGTAITTTGAAPSTAIQLSTDLTFSGDFGTLKGATLSAITGGSDVKLFDIVWTLALDTETTA